MRMIAVGLSVHMCLIRGARAPVCWRGVSTVGRIPLIPLSGASL
ncbi:hypothetical protein HMPREF1318_0224 [Actinomyces massiliensis F0489]|uniref:Uncharacterized protein n=1 Tax=Actinomyces massiliensis F0489 TaxID=1125718 RepID=J0NH16_9ACTO|nr:hypothetical protein HMPREF1318_0224 [Actinomyces massiliensis F0489]